jgi:type IX secretion system PorP/SprF family membrane protein
MKIFLILLLLIKANFCFSQDPHITQFFNTPLLVNPGNTMNTTADIRVGGVIRQQWMGPGDPYYTGNVSFETRLLPSVSGDNVFGIGFNFMHDNTFNGILKSNYFMVNTAYHQYLDENLYHKISVGLNATMGQRFLDINRLYFASQFTSGGFNLNIPSGETQLGQMKRYLSIGTGITYSYADEKKRFELGGSGFHLNKPSQTFLNNISEELPIRWNFNAQTDFAVGYQNGMSFSVLYQKQAALDYILLGGFYNAKIGSESNNFLHIGLFHRWKDSFIPYLGFSINDIQFGFNYDATTSLLNDTNAKPTTFEFSFSWRTNWSDDRPLNCPFSPFK